LREDVLKDVYLDEYDVLRSIVRENFYEFVKEFWDIIIPEKPIWNWHIKYLCRELQYIAERVFRGLRREYDLVINISPGSTKSTLCTIMYPAWIWGRMSSARIIGGSYAHNLSMDLSRRGRDIIKSDRYRLTFPEVVLREDQDTKSYYMNIEGGSRYAVGVGGAVTGMHGHFIIVDDPIDPNKAVSEAEMKTANRWMNETLPTRKVDKSITPTILIMQRLHQNDPSSVMIERAKDVQKGEGGTLKIKHICLPAELTDKVKPRSLRRFYRDGLMDPIRLSREVLNENRMALGEYGFAGQFLQWPVPLGGGMFKTDRIIIDEPPKRWKMRVRYWDKAGTLAGGAFSVGVEMGLDLEKRFWILDVQRGQWDSSKREIIIKQIAQIDGREVIIGIEQEPGSGGKESAENTVRNLAGWKVRVDKPSGSGSSKELRADPFSVQVNNRNVYMVRAEWNLAFLNELEFFPMATYKDQVDAASGAFNILTKGRRRVGGLG
jgi:predicted phage terminase large subunit-like protein